MRSRALAAVLIVAHAFAAATPASAAPVEMTRDRVDHWETFTWDAESGTFPPDGTYTLGSRTTSGDRVRFAAGAKAREGAPVGERLLGTLKLSLRGRKAVRYRGVFTFKVQWLVHGETVVYYRASQKHSFTLRPQPGQRRKVLRFPFDLDTDGQYEVTGRFVASS